jgi:hypothetical protein
MPPSWLFQGKAPLRAFGFHHDFQALFFLDFGTKAALVRNQILSIIDTKLTGERI